MKRFLFFIIFVSSTAHAQDVLRPPLVSTCPDPNSMTCQLFPHACEDCTEEPLDIYRIAPISGAPFDPHVMDYSLKRQVGVVQLAHEKYPVNDEILSHMTNYDLAWEVSEYGFKALKVWMKTSPFNGMGDWCWSTYYGVELCSDEESFDTENMYDFWARTPIDTYVIRPIDERWTWEEHNECTDLYGPQMALADYYSIAKRLYDEIGWRDVTVILGDWEQDWIICAGYEEFLLDIIEQRQVDIERAREEAFLERGYLPKLRVFHSVVVNKYPDNTPESDPPRDRLAELISDMKHKPDFIGLSYWRHGYDPVDTLNWLVEITGYPRSRIYIDEFGSDEWEQPERFSSYIPVFWDWGVRLVNVWMWKTTWCDSKNKGLWQQEQPCSGKVTFGEPTAGLSVLQELNRSVN